MASDNRYSINFTLSVLEKTEASKLDLPLYFQTSVIT